MLSSAATIADCSGQVDQASRRTRKKRYRAAGCPKGVPVLRAALRDPRFCRTDAIVLAVFVWLSANEGEVSITRVAEWLQVHRTTVSRSAAKLRELRFLDNDHQPLPRWRGHFKLPAGHKKPAPGFTYFDFETLRKVASGRKETIAFQAFQTLGELKKVQRDKRGRLEVKARLFATVIGVKSEKTALGVLYRLGAMTLVRVHRTKGHAAWVELVSERERRPAPILPRAKRQSPLQNKPAKPRVGDAPTPAVPEAPTKSDDVAAQEQAAVYAKEQLRLRAAEGIRREEEAKAKRLEQRQQASPPPPFWR